MAYSYVYKEKLEVIGFSNLQFFFVSVIQVPMHRTAVVDMYRLNVSYCCYTFSSFLKNIRNSFGMGVSNSICSLVMGW